MELKKRVILGGDTFRGYFIFWENEIVSFIGTVEMIGLRKLTFWIEGISLK